MKPYREEPKPKNGYEKHDWEGMLKHVTTDWFVIKIFSSPVLADAHARKLKIRFPEYEFASNCDYRGNTSKIFARKKKK